MVDFDDIPKVAWCHIMNYFIRNGKDFVLNALVNSESMLKKTIPLLCALLSWYE